MLALNLALDYVTQARNVLACVPFPKEQLGYVLGTLYFQ